MEEISMKLLMHILLVLNFF